MNRKVTCGAYHFSDFVMKLNGRYIRFVVSLGDVLLGAFDSVLYLVSGIPLTLINLHANFQSAMILCVVSNSDTAALQRAT